MAESIGSQSCQPVFLINNQLPAFEEKNFTTAEICAAAEKVCGFNTIEGAQRIGGLWRLYPRSSDGRLKLLTNGLVLRGVEVSVKSRNPFLVREPTDPEDSGDRIASQPATTKLIIGNIPMSFSDNEILQSVKSLGVTVLSKLIAERDRDSQGKLTHWKTGRRFLYMVVPPSPLPKNVDIGPFKASLYHREQKTKEQQAEAECRRCLTKGHRAWECLAPIRCRQCYKEGHRAGDSVCGLTPLHQPLSFPDFIFPSVTQSGGQPTAQTLETGSCSVKEKEQTNTTKDSETNPSDSEKDRSRPRRRHTQTQLTQYRREGSGSVKRPRSKSAVSQAEKTQKKGNILHSSRSRQRRENRDRSKPREEDSSDQEIFDGDEDEFADSLCT